MRGREVLASGDWGQVFGQRFVPPSVEIRSGAAPNSTPRRATADKALTPILPATLIYCASSESDVSDH